MDSRTNECSLLPETETETLPAWRRCMPVGAGRTTGDGPGARAVVQARVDETARRGLAL
jgi:hypothetical protein